MAQEHLSFKGIPINGTLKQYTAEMMKAGFKNEGTTKEGINVLSGDFAGFKGCYVCVMTIKNCDVVNRISVLFPEKETWSALIDDYEFLKELLTEKYGLPTEEIEEFTRPVYSDNSKIHAISNGEIEWYSVFRTDLGDIELTLIQGSIGYKARVRLTYWDAQNTSTVRQNALDDL